MITIDDNYLEVAFNLLLSLKKYHKDLVIHVIYDNLSAKSVKKLMNFVEEEKIGVVQLYYFDFSSSDFSIIQNDYISTTCYFRLYAPYIITDVDRLLYLDPDIICQKNLEDLYNTDLGDNIIGACPNMLRDNTWYLKDIILENLHLPYETEYVNSGVLLIDMKKYREYLPMEILNDFLHEKKDIIEYQDQDTLNCLFLDKIKILPNYYNYQINAVDLWNLNFDQALIHYSEAKKPWKKDYADIVRGRPYYEFLHELGRDKELKELMMQHGYNNAGLLYDEIIYGEKE